MGALVLDASKVKANVIPRLDSAKNTVQEAYVESTNLRNVIPNSFSNRSLLNDIVNQIYNIKKKINDTSTLVINKIDTVNKIESKNSGKASSITSAAAKIAATVGTGAIAATGAKTVSKVKETAKSKPVVATKEKSIGQKIYDTGAKVVKSAVSGVKKFFTGIADFFKDTASKISKGIKSIWDKVSGTIKNIGNAVVNVAKNVGKKIYDTGAKVVKTVVSGVKKVATGIKNVGSKIVDGVKTAANWVKNTVKTATDWVADKFNKVKDWVSKALEKTGAWISDVGSAIGNAFKTAWDWVTNPESWKKLGATVANMFIGLTKGLISFIEAGVDLAILVTAAATTTITGLVDIVAGLATGEWEWKATSGLWDLTKSAVAFDATGKLSNWFYNTEVGKTLDKYAYGPFKSDGMGFKICEGIGYVAGIVIVSLCTCGIGGAAAAGTTAASTSMSVAMAATAAAAGTAKYTAEEWNKNSISLNYGGTDLDIAMDYETYSEIEKLKKGETKTITHKLVDAEGNPFEITFKITAKGNGKYDIVDNYGNIANLNSLNESSTVKGLGVGLVKGAWEGAQYYVGGQIGTAQFGAVTNSISNPVLQTAARSGIRIALDVGTGVVEVPFQSAVTMVSEGKNWEEAWEAQGGWSAVGQQAAIAGISSFAGEAFSFKNNLKNSEEIIANSRVSSTPEVDVDDSIDNTILSPTDDVTNTNSSKDLNTIDDTSTISNDIPQSSDSLVSSSDPIVSGKKYESYADILDHYDAKRRAFEDGLTEREKNLFANYCGENWLADGNYQSVNGIARGNMIDFEAQTVTVRGTSGVPRVYTFDEFESNFGESVESFVERQTKASIELNEALSKFNLDEDTVLLRGVNWDAFSKYGITPTDTAEEIFAKLTADGNVYVDNGFMSTGVVPTGITSSKPIVLELNCKSGTSGALAESFNPFGENEFLLTGGQKFSIDGVEDVGGQIKVYLTSIPN